MIPPGTSPEARHCPACNQLIGPNIRYCPHCGAYLNPVKDIRKSQRIGRERWRAVKGVILFYMILLGVSLTCFWMPKDWRVSWQLCAVLICATVIIGYWKISRTKLVYLFDSRVTLLRDICMGLGLLVPMLAINIAYHTAFRKLLGVEAHRITEPYFEAGCSTGWVILTACLSPAILEEIAFRGLIQERLRKHLGSRNAFLLTAAMFAIIHKAVFSLPYFFLLGLFLGWLRNRSGSLLPCMFAHFFHNLAILLLELYGGFPW